MDCKILKLGLLVDQTTIPNWLFQSLKKLINDGYGEISLLIFNEHESIKSKNFLFDFYQKIDQKLFVSKNCALKPKALDTLFAEIAKLDFSETKEIKKINLDIIINVSNQNQIQKIIPYARHGIWTFNPFGGYEHFYDVIESKKLLNTLLLMKKIDHQVLLSKVSSEVFGFSLNRDQNEHLWSLASQLPREIKKLSKLEENSYFQDKSIMSGEKISEISTPSNLFMISALAGQSFKIIKKVYEKLFFKEQWFLMYENKENLKCKQINQFQTIIPPKEQFWADPFVVDFEDKRYIFIEEEPLNSHGHISLITLEKDGTHSEAVPILQKPYHISYPFVFSYKNRYFMIPETSENKTIELYEAVDFPYKWKFNKNLMDNLHAVDTTLFHHDDIWWLFTSITDFEDGWDNGSMSVFFSDNLFSDEWKQHPQNPLITNPSNARMAGRVFKKDGKIYRPSQNCSQRYGYGFNLEEITKLSATHYKEKTITSVVPNWDKNVLGTHTVNFAKDFTIIDGVHMRSRYF